MCENRHYESVYFKELHNEQEHYWPTIYRAGANVVSTITSLIYCRVEMCMHNKCMGLLGNLKLVSWYKRTLCHPIWSVIILVIKQIKLPLCSRPILLITRIHDFKLVGVKRRLRTVVSPMEIGTLSIDNETHDDDASQPRQTGPRVSFSVGKTKFKQCSFPDRRRLFLCKEVCLVTVLLWHSKTSVIYIL